MDICHTSGAVELIRSIPAVYNTVASPLKWETGSIVATVEMRCQIASYNGKSTHNLLIGIQHIVYINSSKPFHLSPSTF
jgi:hypothetical protein